MTSGWQSPRHSGQAEHLLSSSAHDHSLDAALLSHAQLEQVEEGAGNGGGGDHEAFTSSPSTSSSTSSSSSASASLLSCPVTFPLNSSTEYPSPPSACSPSQSTSSIFSRRGLTPPLTPTWTSHPAASGSTATTPTTPSGPPPTPSSSFPSSSSAFSFSLLSASAAPHLWSSSSKSRCGRGQTRLLLLGLCVLCSSCVLLALLVLVVAPSLTRLSLSSFSTPPTCYLFPDATAAHSLSSFYPPVSSSSISVRASDQTAAASSSHLSSHLAPAPPPPCSSSPNSPACQPSCVEGSQAQEWDPIFEAPGWLVEGYANATSVETGQALSLHLSTSVYYPQLSCATVDLHVYRFPFGEVRMDDTFLNIPHPHANAALLPPQSLTVVKQAVPDLAWRDGCQWPASAILHIPDDWQPGLYVARVSSPQQRRRLEEGEGWSNYQLPYLDVQFVVKRPLHLRGSYSPILMHVASHTAQAYNVWTGGAVYEEESFYSGQRSGPKALSYLRPYSANAANLTADRTTNFASPWQHSSVRVDMASRWELQFLLWASSKRIPVELLTSVDLHVEGAATLQPELYNIFLSVGHDEYWTVPMIHTVQSFIRRGGNAMFLGGNTMYWKVHSPSAQRIVCDKSKNQTHDLEGKKNQSRDHLGTISSTVTGLSFHGGQREASRVPTDSNLYHALRPDDDFFRHVSGGPAALRRFGLYSRPDGVQLSISGYEADTVLLDAFHLPELDRADAPMNFVALARESFAVIGYFHNGGTVFNGASTDYAAALSPYGDRVIQRLTQNAFSMLNTPAAARMAEVYEMVSVAADTSTFYYYQTTPFAPPTAPYLQYSHTAFKGHTSADQPSDDSRSVAAALERASAACRVRGFFSWEKSEGDERVQFLSPHRNASELEHDRFEVAANGFTVDSLFPLFFAYDPACRPSAVSRLRLMPVYHYVAQSPLRFRYSPSRLPALVHWSLGGVAFYVPADDGSSVCASRAMTPLGSLYALTVKPLPLFTTHQLHAHPWLSSYEYAQCSFQVSTSRLHRGHVPVYRMRRVDSQSGWIHFRLAMDQQQAELNDWEIDAQATPRGDGVLFYAADAPDASILHSTPLYEYTRSMHTAMTAYGYDLGGTASRLYSQDGYNASMPVPLFYVPRPLLVDVYRSWRAHAQGKGTQVTSYALTVSPFLFSFALHNSGEAYREDGELPVVRGRAGWLFHALSYPVADAVPVYVWFSVDLHGQRRYRYHPSPHFEDMVGGRKSERTGNGWMLSTADQADGIAFYAFSSNHSAAQLQLDLQAVYEVQLTTASPLHYVYTTLATQAQLSSLPAHYELVHDTPLFYTPAAHHTHTVSHTNR